MIKINKLLMVLVCVLISTLIIEVQAQQTTVKGTIRDVEGNPIIGASVVEKGTNNGVATDAYGEYGLTVKNPQSVIQVSYLGYLQQESAVGNKKQLDFVLEEDTRLMDEVVVIGYGTQRKGDVTSAIVSVKAEDFLSGKVGDAAELVKGKVAGLSIVKSSGDPNATSSIMLRGITTITGSVSPLVLVDGIEGSLTTVAPENIVSIDVLKDASAAAIYGTRGANGVILISTKTGKRDSRVNTSYNSYVSFSDWYKKMEFMDTNDVIYGLTNFPYEGYDTDWLKAISRKAGYTQNHSFSIDGGGQSSSYAANITFSNEEGILRKSDDMNMKIQIDVNQYAFDDILKFNVNLLYGRHKNTHNNNSFAYRQALIHNPSSPVFNEDGSYYEEFSRYQYFNPLEMQNEMIGDTRSHNARITGNITVEPIKGWQTNLMLAMRENADTGETYYTSKYYSQVVGGVNGWASKSSGNFRQDQLELTSKYNLVAGKSRMTALAGYSYLYNVSDSFSAGNGNFPSESYLYNDLAQGTYLTDADHTASMGSSKSDDKLIGFFGRLTYNYGDKYNVLLSVRREGSSKFGKNNKWGTFPSASVAWTISNEEIFKSVSELSNLKLRAGYGVTGVIPGSSYLSLTTYDYDSYGKHLSTSGRWTPSLMVAQNPNPNLKWETTREISGGLEWGFFDGRLNGTIDVYQKTTKDLLYWYSVPVPPNMYSSTLANVGKMQNRGYEIMINAIPVKTRDFEYNTTFTLSHNSNKLLSLSNDLYETDNFAEVGGVGEPITIATHCMEVGHTLGDFWGLKSVGVSKDGFVLVEVAQFDENNNKSWVVKEFDTKYNLEENRQRLGNGMPDIYAGWNHTVRYKNVDLSIQLTSQLGYQILNSQRSFYENNSIAYNRLKTAANYYGAINTDGTPYIDPETGQQKQVRLSSSMQQGIWSDHIEDGDFVKLSNLTLGYTVPFKGKAAKYVKKAHIYVSGHNLFCITGYSGLDPEVSNYFLSPGLDERDKYPTIRSVSVGLNLNF
ncbi:MAG: SusC/RagA family TonB-linked outer membrane protein [Dysgonamonadaceae bacterium]|nr:SusC/RagA family TonB-linked outer membrane protein [Dysgonamonadaceae bacterium]